MDNLSEGILRCRKECEVKYIADSDVLHMILPIGMQKSCKLIKESTLLSSVARDDTITVVTRSGRKVTSSTAKHRPSVFSQSENENSDDTEVLNADVEKPSNLFDHNVAGSDMFSFCTPKRVKVSLRTTNVADKLAKTPSNIRVNVGKKIKQKVYEEIEEMFDSSGSEYEPSNSSDSSSEDECDDIMAGIRKLPFDSPSVKKSVNDEYFMDIDTAKTSDKKSTQPSSGIRISTRNKKPSFVLASDDYFDRHNSRTRTSNNTLAKLGQPMSLKELTSLLADFTPSHRDFIRSLNRMNAASFDRWMYSLKCGYNIVVYGLGSKKSLLNWFRKTYLVSSLVLVVNGYFPSLVVKDLIDSIIELLDLKGVDASSDIISKIGQSKKRLFVIVNNLDGQALRSDKAQSFLSSLAALSNIHLIASIDHINAPLLWDQAKLGKFNFIWEDGTSFLPYKDETSFESSYLIKVTGNIALTALKNVLNSLTSNQRKIFKILMDHYIDANGKTPGMNFSDLYHTCRLNFIVSSDLALRTLLTEFLDHELLKWKKESDLLTISVDLNTLKQYKMEMELDGEN